MKRRQWLTLATQSAGTLLLPACSGLSTRPSTLDLAALDFRGAEGHGVWQQGRLVAGRSPSRDLPSLSITKSIATLAALRAHAEGWLAMDEPLVGTLTEWRRDPPKHRITVRMLVNQTAGFPSGAAELYRARLHDKGRVAVALPLVDPPGSRFRYGPACTEVLAEVLRRKLTARGTDLTHFLARLLRQMGVASPEWRADGIGTPYLSTGAEFSIKHLGRLGEVIGDLASGRDRCGISAAAFLDLASPRPANPMFAAGIWWNRNANRPGARSIEPERHLNSPLPPAFWQNACLATTADPGWLALVGSGGKRVYVLPAHGLVIARVGRSRDFSDAAFLRAVSVS